MFHDYETRAGKTFWMDLEKITQKALSKYALQVFRKVNGIILKYEVNWANFTNTRKYGKSLNFEK